MYIISFYSFKGGVGRTTAMMNVGTELARSGARVLLVDFDLEAPSLMTFNLAGTGRPHKGLVDYVQRYVETGEAPDAAEFICKSETFVESGGQLWVMPAGERGPEYRRRNFALSWKELYEKKEGFLFIENLKAQWQELLQPDYVLIDSRTGHNEVLGICTRQLPNAVCAVFVPNPQNLDGLREVVNDIRTQKVNSDGAPIQLHFVASNVPYEDDERGTLATMMARYKEELEAPRVFEIHHFGLLALFGQGIFVQTAPTLSLSREYRGLTNLLRMDNLEDRTSALRYLSESLWRTSVPREPATTEAKLKFIADRHKDDPEVLLELARVRREMGATADAAVLLEQSIASGKATGRAYIERASLYLQKENGERFEAARSDFIEAIRRLDATAVFPDTLLAVRSLATLGGGNWKQLAALPSIAKLPPIVQLALTDGLDTSDEEMQATRYILYQIRKSSALTGTEERTWRTRLAHALIRLREYSEAIALLAPRDLKIAALTWNDAFNLAIAMWGRDGAPPEHLFRHVLECHAEEAAPYSAHYYECLAIAALMCDEKTSAKRFRDQSRDIVNNMAGMEFSASEYLRISPVNFLRQLVELGTAIDSGDTTIPPALGR